MWIFKHVWFYIGLLALATVGYCVAVTIWPRPPLEAWQEAFGDEEKLRVGFDLDGTLVFSRPTFARAFEQTKPLSPECYALVNSSDEAYSKIRTPVKKILDKHRTRGDEIFVVTSRGPKNGDKLKEYLSFNFGVLPVDFLSASISFLRDSLRLAARIFPSKSLAVIGSPPR